MSSPKSLIRRKAAKAIVAHSAHGSIAKVRRRPARTATLIALGAALGSALGFLAGRRTSAPGPDVAAPVSPYTAPTTVADAVPDADAAPVS